jgi:hypothetical protein
MGIFGSMIFVRVVAFFTSPEWKVQSELLVSKGDGPASIVQRHASTVIFFSGTAGQIYLKFGL